MSETPAIEKETVERTFEELDQAPRIDTNLLRNRTDHHTFFIEFEDDPAVIKCTIKKGVSWQKMAKARQRARNVVQKADGTIIADIDNNALMRDLWGDIIVTTDPKITLADLDTYSGIIAGEIFAKIIKEYKKFAPDIKVKKK